LEFFEQVPHHLFPILMRLTKFLKLYICIVLYMCIIPWYRRPYVEVYNGLTNNKIPSFLGYCSRGIVGFMWNPWVDFIRIFRACPLCWWMSPLYVLLIMSHCVTNPHGILQKDSHLHRQLILSALNKYCIPLSSRYMGLKRVILYGILHLHPPRLHQNCPLLTNLLSRCSVSPSHLVDLTDN